MKFLRIIFLSELDDGFARNFKGFGLKPIAHLQIVKITLFHRKKLQRRIDDASPEIGNGKRNAVWAAVSAALVTFAGGTPATTVEAPGSCALSLFTSHCSLLRKGRLAQW